MKICTKCGESKELDDFYLKHDGRDGRQRECKACRAIYKAQHYQANKEDLKAKHKKYAADNKETINKYQNKWQKANPDKTRDFYLWNRYRIRLVDYNILLEQQGSCCKICSKTPEELGEVLVVDHDHVTNEIRGLLCWNCNVGLGHFFDSLLTLEAAQRYLLKA